MATIKITELTSIGANLTSSTVIPVVNMSGTPTTEKTLLGNIANVVLAGAGGNYTAAAISILAQSVTNAAQPNITSTGTLTNLTVSGNVAVNGNITGNGTAYVGNLSTTGIASITTLSVGATANLGAVGNVKITGGTAGQVLSTDGAGNLSWASDSTTYGNSNVAAYLPTYTGNIGADIVTANLFVGSGANLTSIAGANVSGFVPNANVANTAFAVAAANVTGLGNIATINLDGSNSNVLYGNGAFAAVPATAPAGSNGEIQFNISGAFASTGNLTFVDGISGGTLEIGPPGVMQLDGNGTIVASSLTSSGNVFVEAGNGIVDLRATGNIVLKSDNANYEWVFGDDGNLILAGGSSVIQSIANSSLDPTLPNVSTMTLTPDQNYTSQVLVLDPTAPGHIHLRAYAFSNIDEPAANIFLGGEDTSFEVTSGSNNEARIHSGGNTWTFGNDGRLTFPGTPRIDTATNNFEVQAAEAISLEANTVVNIYTDAGNNAYQWQFGDDGNLTLPGYLISTINDSLNATGTVQANAALLSKSYNIVTGSNVSPINGVILPASPIAGTTIVVAPRANTGDIKIYPQSGGTIEYGTINDPLQIVANQPGNTITFVATSSTNWITG